MSWGGRGIGHACLGCFLALKVSGQGKGMSKFAFEQGGRDGEEE